MQSVLEFLDGSEAPMSDEPLFRPVWARAEKALSEVFGKMSFQDLLDEHERQKGKAADHYVI